jgi:hypothetical protein
MCTQGVLPFPAHRFPHRLADALFPFGSIERVGVDGLVMLLLVSPSTSPTSSDETPVSISEANVAGVVRCDLRATRETRSLRLSVRRERSALASA